MGNTQSSILDPDAPRKSRRRSHRLSKPMTGNHATAGLLSPGGFSNSTRRLSNVRMSFRPPPPSPASTPTTTTTTDTTPMPASSFEYQSGLAQYSLDRSASAVSIEQKESRRRSLFRSRSSQGTSDSSRRQRSTGPVSRVADRLGRTNSMTYESAISYYGQTDPESWFPSSRSRASWNYDLTSYEAKRLLNLTEEPVFEHATAMSENKMTVVTETTWKSSNPANADSTPISRANSDLSMYVPIRRRSVIQKPGVATRSNSMRDDTMSSRPFVRYSHPPTPSLSRQTSFESHRGGVMSMPPPSHDPDAPRVLTPCEDNYQSIGAFKLGSLRITNGAASPASPELERGHRRGSPDQSSPGPPIDYFDHPPLHASSSKQPSTPPKTATVLPRVPPSLANVPSGNATVAGDLGQMQNGTLSTTNAASPEYLADIAFSPFSLKDALSSSPGLQTTSKATALEDELFEDDSRGEFSPVEVLDVRQDPSAKPGEKSAEGTSELPFSRTDSGFVSAGDPSERAYKPLAKADSGYSSNVSLRSFQAKAQERDLTLSLDKRSSHSTRRTGSMQSQNRSLSNASSTSYSTAPEREAPPPVPPKDYPPTSPTQTRGTKSTAPGAKMPRGSSGSKTIPPPIISVQPHGSGLKSPESLPRTPGSAKSGRSERSMSALSIGSGSNKPSKLQRFLSSARRPAAAPTTTHPTHAEKPTAPRFVEPKSQEHIDVLPVAKKRLAPKARPSMDTLKTIFSVGSLETSLEAPMGIPRLSEESEPLNKIPSNPKESSWRDTLQAMPLSIATAAANVIPRKPVARKPVPPPREAGKGETKEPVQRGSPDSTVLSDADLSTYASAGASLGDSAYDAGLVAMAGSREGALSPEIVSRTLSLNETTLRQLEMRSPGLSLSPLNLNLPSPALPSPLLAKTAASQMKARSSPPVSMVTRRPMSLRVPPPLRSQSSTASLTHKTSRESIQSYPSAQPLARKTSRDSIRSYPAYGLATTDSASDRSEFSPPIPPMDPRRIMAFRHGQSVQQKEPKWDIQTDHDMSRQGSRSNSMHGNSRHNSLTSAPAQAGYAIQRPSSAQAWQVRTAKPQQLKHRASYDGFNMQQRRGQYGHAPAMSNGYTAQPRQSYDPWNSNSQFDPGHGLQDNRYPPYVPRGHHRNRSINRASSTSVPYRVLHSYNSPAYRGVPIWG